MQPTIKLYEGDSFLSEFEAAVISCAPQGGSYAVVLDATAFYPEGGGQPCDTGTINGAAVTAVHEQGGVIIHTCAAPLAVGSAVHGKIDAARRLDHMQQHSGEHILSGTLHRLYSAENVGFHIGSPAVRMDVSLPLTAEQLARAEAEANAVVRANLPIRCWYPEAAELAATTYRSKKPLDGAVRLVDAGGADLCACCGTHLQYTGQVGLIKILSAQNYKGGVRLAVACGQRAYDAVAAAWADAERAGRLLSVAPGGLAAAAQLKLDAENGCKQRIFALQAALAESYAHSAVPGKASVYMVPAADGDGARKIALAVCGKTAAPCAVFFAAKSPDMLSYALAAPDGVDIRPTARAVNEACAGHGGGKAGYCQGSIPAAAMAKAEELLAALC